VPSGSSDARVVAARTGFVESSATHALFDCSSCAPDPAQIATSCRSFWAAPTPHAAGLSARRGRHQDEDYSTSHRWNEADSRPLPVGGAGYRPLRAGRSSLRSVSRRERTDRERARSPGHRGVERHRSRRRTGAGRFVHTDVADPAASAAAVAAAEQTYGRLDFAHLNAGIAAQEGAVDAIDLATYRRITGINLDGVFFGLQAVVPALRRAGGGSIVATASLAGLVPTPFTPVYSLTKHAVVGLVRSVADALRAENIRVSAVAPGFAETAIIAPMKAAFDESGFPLLTAEEVADVVLQAMDGEPGSVWPIQPGRTAEPYRFRGVPGPRVVGKEGVAPPAEGAPAADVPADGAGS
jgi:NAD(P)-dependent dehydrogenase (short-subunit alcohol dehydrogenase family)